MASLKRLLYIFIPVFAILLMSHNSFAISPVLNLNDYALVRGVGSFNQTCSWTNGENYQNGGQCSARINGRTRLTSITSDTKYSFETNDLLVVYLFVWSDSNSLTFEYQPRLNSFGEVTSGFDVLGYNLIDYNTYYDRILGEDGFINWPPNNDMNINFTNNGYFYRIYELTLRCRSKANLSIGLVSNSGLFEFNTHDTGSTIYFSLRNAKQYRFDGDEANKEVEEKTQDAADDSQDAGDDSSSDAETATSSLISVIGGFVNVLTSAQPTNCKINANLNHIDMGQLDLCANPVPSYIQIIGSIILICAAIPLAIVLFNRFIGLFRSFQG